MVYIRDALWESVMYGVGLVYRASPDIDRWALSVRRIDGTMLEPLIAQIRHVH